MITIRTYSEIDKQNWKSLAETSPLSTWFQTEEAYRFYQSVSDMDAFVYGVVEEDKLVGVIVGYTTQEKCKLKQYFTARTIVVGGPLLDENISESALAMLLQIVKKQQGEAIYIETRNLHDYSRWRTVFEANDFAYQPHLNIQVACNANHTMSEQRQRQVKKAIKNGAEICEASSEQEIRDWYQILRQLYLQKVRTPLWSEAFFLLFYRSGVGKFLLVKYEGKVIGGMMCPIFAGKAIYEWYVCGLDEAYREQYPSVMATYAAIEYAKQKGIPMFDFMGAGVPDKPYGVRDFKMEFGGAVVKHGRYLCVRKSLLYKIGKWGVKILKSGKIW
ncbi:MAG: GNAT family N-acetyltransferase [Paludibacteraceae bacterium]|nr:GNAT family N-acetyltransferase [Paludibacteraceae bacterium]